MKTKTYLFLMTIITAQWVAVIFYKAFYLIPWLSEKFADRATAGFTIGLIFMGGYLTLHRIDTKKAEIRAEREQTLRGLEEMALRELSKETKIN